jgi:hypothetical protein
MQSTGQVDAARSPYRPPPTPRASASLRRRLRRRGTRRAQRAADAAASSIRATVSRPGSPQERSSAAGRPVIDANLPTTVSAPGGPIDLHLRRSPRHTDGNRHSAATAPSAAGPRRGGRRARLGPVGRMPAILRGGGWRGQGLLRAYDEACARRTRRPATWVRYALAAEATVFRQPGFRSPRSL